MSVAATAQPADDGYPLEFDARLVEESVLLAIDRAPAEDRGRFHRERDPIYELPAGDERESRFHALHGRWFVRLSLADSLRQSIAREPAIAAGTTRGLVVPVVSARSEYADLRPDRRGEGRSLLLLCLRVTTLVECDRLVPFLRHELLHVADMLDPEFGFDPELPMGDDPALENVLRQRYQTLWDVTIDGRLAARGELPTAAQEARQSEFLGIFSMLGESGGSCFARFFDGPRPSHAELVAFAAAPGRLGEGWAAGRCSLCRMPTVELQPNPTQLGTATLAAIRGDFPGWQPQRGLCRQCAELYGASARRAPRMRV